MSDVLKWEPAGYGRLEELVQTVFGTYFIELWGNLYVAFYGERKLGSDKDIFKAREFAQSDYRDRLTVAQGILNQRAESAKEKYDKRKEAQIASYRKYYGQHETPKRPGFYWAFWLSATKATVDGDELTPAMKWDVVEVDHNMTGGDPNHPEYWLVAVPGVQAHQYVGNFIWGPRVPDFNPDRHGNVFFAREFWIMRDHQTGQWCVEDEPVKVVRPGAEVIHVREMRPIVRPEPK